MSFDKAAFNAIYDDLIANDNKQIGSAKSGDDLIRLGWMLAQSSIALWVLCFMFVPLLCMKQNFLIAEIIQPMPHVPFMKKILKTTRNSCSTSNRIHDRSTVKELAEILRSMSLISRSIYSIPVAVNFSTVTVKKLRRKTSMICSLNRAHQLALTINARFPITNCQMNRWKNLFSVNGMQTPLLQHL